MSLYKRGKIWWSRIEIDHKPHQFSTKARDKNTARSVEAARRTELVKGRVGLSAPRLSDFAPRFINSLPGRVSKPTYRFYVCHIQPLLNFPALAECPLDRINPERVEDFVNWRRKQPGRSGTVTAATINHSLRSLHRMLALASDWNLIAKVPKITLIANEHQRDYVLRPETVAKFAEQKGPIGRIVPFLVDTGLRRREICELTWDRVNLPQRSIKISRGKSKFARRTVPLTNRAVEILRELPRDGDFVFSIRGRRMTEVWLSHAFLKVRRKLKLPADCVLHSTRHTAASIYGADGASPYALQKFMGWSDIKMAMRYCHTEQVQLEQMVDRRNCLGVTPANRPP